MSRETSSTKKSILESELSQASEITLLSNVTQTTDLSNDLDDNYSDSSSTNSNNKFYGSRSNVTNNEQTQVLYARERPAKKALRKCQVSWSIDDDETFVKESPQRQIAPYDNNFNGTNNSCRRTRRATESSIDNHALSYVQPLSILNGNSDSCNHQFGVPYLRSNTTSQIHGHKNKIQKQRLIDELVRQYGTCKLQQRRSQSVSSLRTDSHMYESLQQQRQPAQVVINHPVETVVTMPYPDTNLHQKTETKVRRNMKHDSFTTLNYLSGLSDESSAYADVIRYKSSQSSKGNQHQMLCFNDCNSSFYLNGFFLLLMFNVILVMLNSFGVPFVYSAIKQKNENENRQGIVEAQRSQICMKCDMLIRYADQELESSEVTKTKDKECCFKSVEQLLPALLTTVNATRSPHADPTTTVPVVQLKADKKNNETDDKEVIWETDINTMEAYIVQKKSLRIPATGYYYVYSRVHYEKPKGNDINSNKEFTIGHMVMKKKSGNLEELIDKIVQRCFPSNSSGDVRHTNHLGSVQHLRKDDELFVKLDHKQYFDYTNTIFGVFQVAK